eukprot:TRINITY_DN34311_c1_g1_i1.p1 TRINITY_DN34311_c1_g1~~TRINITY_DN34311_c1_g1_i1.p1  ORF type:complete len:464 (-),score=97.88 TRINITY_DN34311_c1_g1_i1:60-1451(-)
MDDPSSATQQQGGGGYEVAAFAAVGLGSECAGGAEEVEAAAVAADEVAASAKTDRGAVGGQSAHVAEGIAAVDDHTTGCAEGAKEATAERAPPGQQEIAAVAVADTGAEVASGAVAEVTTVGSEEAPAVDCVGIEAVAEVVEDSLDGAKEAPVVAVVASGAADCADAEAVEETPVGAHTALVEPGTEGEGAEVAEGIQTVDVVTADLGAECTEGADGTERSEVAVTKQKPEVRAPLSWKSIKEHLNEGHQDVLYAIAVYYGELQDVEQAHLIDVELDGFHMEVEMYDRTTHECFVPWAEEYVTVIEEVPKAIVAMSMKARNNVFVTHSGDIKQEDKVYFDTFNELSKLFVAAVVAGDYMELASFYSVDATLVTQVQGPVRASSPILCGRDAIRNFFVERGQPMFSPVKHYLPFSLKPMRLYQTTTNDVVEIGRAWGHKGRPYSRRWRRKNGEWLLRHDVLPVN